jgi:multiple sugar transport system substrate-binding protein
VDGFQFKVDLYSKHRVEGGAWRSGGIRDDMGFQSRKYAMIFNGPWAVKGLQRGGIDFGVALIPAGPAGHATNVGGNNLVVFSTSEHPEEACKLLMFIASKESQVKWANSLGQIPVNVLADQDVDLEGHPYLEVFMEQMKYAKPRPPTGSYPEIENDVNPEMQAALDGKKSVEAAMRSACEKVKAIIAEEEALKASLREQR